MMHDSAGMGHNIGRVPGSEEISDHLRWITEGLRGEISSAVDTSARVPQEISNEDEAQRTGDFVGKINDLIKQAEDIRKAEKEPYLVGGRTVDGFFSDLTDQLNEMKRVLNSRLGKYQAAKRQAAEKSETIEKPTPIRTDYGHSVTTREELVVSAVERGKANLAKLKPYLDEKALEKAARAYGQQNKKQVMEQVRKGEQPIKGVTFAIEQKTVTRRGK